MESVRTALVAEVADAELAPPARERGNKKYNGKKQRMQAQDKSKTHQLKLCAAMLKLLCAPLGLEPTTDAADRERGNYYGELRPGGLGVRRWGQQDCRGGRRKPAG